MHFSCPFHDYQLKLCALTGPHIAHNSSHPFTLSKYHILDFWCKIRFRIHIIIIQGQMRPLKNININKGISQNIVSIRIRHIEHA